MLSIPNIVMPHKFITTDNQAKSTLINQLNTKSNAVAIAFISNEIPKIPPKILNQCFTKPSKIYSWSLPI